MNVIAKDDCLFMQVSNINLYFLKQILLLTEKII